MWDQSSDLLIGCDYGGSLELHPEQDSAITFTMTECGLAHHHSVNADGAWDFEQGLFSIDYRMDGCIHHYVRHFETNTEELSKSCK